MRIPLSKTGVVAVTVLVSAVSFLGASAVAAPSRTAALGGAATTAAGDSTDATAARSARQRRATFATPRSTGVPRGWEPRRTIRHDKTVTKRGAVVRDLRIMGNLTIAAPGVRLVRVDVVGGSIDNWAGSTCQTGLRIRRSTIRRAPDQQTYGDEPAVQAGGYVARRVKIKGLPEGFRVGGKDECGRVVLRRSYARVTSPNNCGDWHGDALQGYDGGRVKIRDSRLDLVEKRGCGGTAPFFYPRNQGNTSVDIDGLIVNGGGYSFRLGMPGDVRRLKVVRGGWYYGPIDVNCAAVGAWKAHVVKLSKRGQPRNLHKQRCNTRGGY